MLNIQNDLFNENNETYLPDMKYGNSLLSISDLADILSTSKRNIEQRIANGKLVPDFDPSKQRGVFYMWKLRHLPEIRAMLESKWEEELDVAPKKPFKLVELFAGGGGLAIGLEKAGFESLLLNEFDKAACKTLRHNRPEWNVVEGDVAEIDFTEYKNKVDVLSGGFPCQAFSYAGKRLGFEDTRGTLFFEFARAVKETNPKILIAENVKGLLSHEKGETLHIIKDIIGDLGYELVEPKVMKAIFYKVPQKRERLILVGIRKDLAKKASFQWPSPYHKIMTVRDAFFAGELYKDDVPESDGQKYPQRKKEILQHVPEGGYWRDLNDELQREFMQGSYFLGGGKTGLARRLSWDQPSLTLTTAPAQKQTERCHPSETRPLTVREYARIQTFPDDWFFCGSLAANYKQIGNAVPVNMAAAIGRSLIRLLNQLEI